MWYLKTKGLEAFYGLFTIVEYITCYTCKGGDKYGIWGDAMKSLVTTYIDNGHIDTHICSLCPTITNNISEVVSTPRAQYMFVLSGVNLKISLSMNTILKL